MNTTVSDSFLEVQNRVQLIFSQNKDYLNEVKLLNKKLMKNITSTANKTIFTIQEDTSFFDNYSNNGIGNFFLSESLDLSDSIITRMASIDVKTLLKDNNFYIFLKYIIIFDSVYTKRKSYLIIDKEYIDYMRLFFGNIKSIVLSYFLIKENNLTLNKIQNITSFICKGGMVGLNKDLSMEQNNILEQILSGIKDIKVKEPKPNTFIEKRQYTKTKKFDILEKVKRSICIKYTTIPKKVHKSKKKHWRKGYFRTLSDGRKIYIKGCWVNADK